MRRLVRPSRAVDVLAAALLAGLAACSKSEPPQGSPAPSPLGPAGSHEGCKSGFGVYAMHGFVGEWTKSPWGRGDGEKEGSVALRGGFGSSPYADMRCSAAKASAPGEAGAQVGFRCCGGPENSAEVELPEAAEDLAVIEAVEPLEDALVARVKRAIANGQLKEEPGFSYSIEKVWRWRPVKNEDLYVARYVATPSGGGAAIVQPVVVQLCERTALLLSRTRGPVSDLRGARGQPGERGGGAGEREGRRGRRGGAVQLPLWSGERRAARLGQGGRGRGLGRRGRPRGRRSAGVDVGGAVRRAVCGDPGEALIGDIAAAGRGARA